MVYAFIFIIILGVWLNYLSEKYVLYNLIYKREISKRIVEIGEEFEITTVLENKKILPVTFLQIVEKYPSALNYKFKAVVQPTKDYVYHTATMLLMPYQRVKRKYKVSFSHRGRFILRDVTLIGGDFLGFNTFPQNTEFSQDIVVLPKPADLDEMIIPYGDYTGDFSVKRWIIDDPILTVGIREYTGTESERIIHWPSSLRTGRLMVKKFDFTSDNNAMILLNIECVKPFWSGIDQEKIEKCISIARSVIEHFEESGIPYSLISNAYLSGYNESGSIEKPGIGMSHFYNLIETLGRIDYGIYTGFEELINKLISFDSYYTTFVIITPSVLDQYIEPINNLAEKSMKTSVISLEQKNIGYLNTDIDAFVERRWDIGLDSGYKSVL